MILKELYLYPDLAEYPDEIVHPFRDQSRSICNFLERELKAIRFNTEGFKRICIIGKSSPTTESFINSSKVLIVEVPFDENQYKVLERAQLNSFFAQMLVTGIEKCQKDFDIPGNELLKGLESFRDSGYVNEWTFKAKTLKNIGVKCTLECKLTLEAFHLSLVIKKGKEVIFSREILETEPDELVFAPMFKDVDLVGDSLVILDRYGDITYSLRVDELSL